MDGESRLGPYRRSQSSSLKRPFVNVLMPLTSISKDEHLFDLSGGGKSYMFLNKAVSYGGRFKSIKIKKHAIQ